MQVEEEAVVGTESCLHVRFPHIRLPHQHSVFSVFMDGTGLG